MRKRQIIQKRQLRTPKRVHRDRRRDEPIQEGQHLRRLGGVLRPQDVPETVGVERGDEPDEVVGELFAAVDVEEVCYVELYASQSQCEGCMEEDCYSLSRESASS